MDRLIVAILIIFLIFCTITFLLHRFLKNKRLKYVPSYVSLIAAAINIMQIRIVQGEGFKDLAKVLMAVFLFSGFLSGVLTGLYIDYLSPRLKKKK
jgi:uncharacterized protein YebE (UPF0316 family)